MQDWIAIIEANWLAFVLALAIGLLVAWWLYGRSAAKRRARLRTRHRAPDALDEGAAPAARNQALIDAPSAVTVALRDTGAEIAALGTAQVAEPVLAPRPPPPPPKSKPKPAPKPRAARKPEPAAAPVVEALPPPPAPPPPPALPPKAAGPDDLAQIKGLGPKLQALLPTLGVTTFAQIAAWDEAEIDRIDAQLGTFQGRIRKDNWVEQAKFLAGGDVAGYEAKFGKL